MSELVCAWKGGRSIYEQLSAWDGESPLELADEEPGAASRLRFASGARDGILTHHTTGPSSGGPSSGGPSSGRDAGDGARVDVVDSVLFSLERLVRTGNDHARDALYELLRDDTVVAHADEIVDRLTRQRRLSPQQIRPYARRLLRESAHREPLKLAMILLGVAGTAEDVEDLKVLARHDEFTLYAAVAAANLLDDPRDVWWEMAQRVHGWGKIHLVERLGEDIDDRPDIQGWLLRHGCDNAVMPEYLAFVCASAGRLADALLEAEIDDALRAGACTIVQALLAGGPAQDMDDYGDGALATRRLMEHLGARCPGLEELRLVVALADWLDDRPGPFRFVDDTEDPVQAEAQRRARWERREALGWDEPLRAELSRLASRVCAAPRWPAEVRAAFSDDDNYRRWLAWRVASAVGVDLWDDGLARLCRDPLDAATWFELVHLADDARLGHLVALAEERLPLADIARGPDTEHGFGPEYRAHGCLDALLQEMERASLYSDRLLAAALRSPVLRNRHLAAAALASCRVGYGPLVRDALARTISDEPDDELRDSMSRLSARL